MPSRPSVFSFIPSRAILRGDAAELAVQLGAGRTALATLIFAAPVPVARLLGVDSATAARVTWLTRMMAVRDGALGVGAVDAARRGGRPSPWLAAGAVSDAVDAVVVAAAIKQGRVGGLLARGLVVGAAGAAAVGAVAAVRNR